MRISDCGLKNERATPLLSNPQSAFRIQKRRKLMDNNGANGSKDSKDMLYLVGGIALLIAGAGLIMAHPMVRQQLRANLGRVLPNMPEGLSRGLSTIVPDFQRYMKIRQM
jgi:hypothetical protein